MATHPGVEDGWEGRGGWGEAAQGRGKGCRLEAEDLENIFLIFQK